MCSYNGWYTSKKKNAEGARTTPSVVAFTDSDEKLVGQPAQRPVTNPENTIFAVKRLIGRNFNDTTVKKDIETAPFKIINSDKGDAWIELKSKIFTLSNFSFCYLLEMKETAEKYLGQEVSRQLWSQHILMMHKDKQQKMLVKLQA